MGTSGCVSNGHQVLKEEECRNTQRLPREGDVPGAPRSTEGWGAGGKVGVDSTIKNPGTTSQCVQITTEYPNQGHR